MGHSLTVCHVTLSADAFSFQPGVLRQLQHESEAAISLRADGITWDTVVLSPDSAELRAVAPRTPTIRWIPKTRVPRIGMRIGFWRAVRDIAADYDYVFVRYNSLNPFSGFYLKPLRNVMMVHHTKSVEETRLESGRLKAALEKVCLKFATNNCKYVIGVTEEIAASVAAVSGDDLVQFVLPNGINVPDPDTLEDGIKGDELVAVFTSSWFYPWQGLDLLIAAAAARAHDEFPKLSIHLVGTLTDADQETLRRFSHPTVRFVVEGLLDSSQLTQLYRRSDVAIGSLALYRKDLNQACTLKVREYLSHGLPVYTAHEDVAIPPDFPFYVNEPNVDLSSLVGLAMKGRNGRRRDVLTEAAPYISKRRMMANLIRDIQRYAQRGVFDEP